jgi:hypothetical protein
VNLSADSILGIRQESGRLISNPTSTDASSNYGGTVLGEIAYIECRIYPRYRPKFAEEFGGHPIDAKWLGETPVISGVLRNGDPDMINVLFANTALGASRGRGIMGQANGSIRAGADLSDRSIKLLFAPNDSEHGDHCILYRALPEINMTTAIGLYLGREKGIPFAFYGTVAEDAKRSTHQIDLRENLVITPT